MSDQLLKEILSELKTLNQRVGHIETDVAGVKADINDLKTGQARLEDDNVGIRADITGIKEDIAGVTADINDLKTGQARLEDGQKRLELRLENEVIEKIRALFDARQVHEDKISLLIEGQEDIKTDLRYLVARVVNFEKVAR